MLSYSVHIINNHKHIIIVLSWYLFEVLPPQIKCPDHPFSSTMMMSLKRLKSSLLSEEVLDYLMKMEGTIIDHLIIEQSCVWWVCYNQIYLIDRKYLFLNFYWKSFREAEDYYNTWIMSNIGKWMIWHVRLSEAALLSKFQKLKSIHSDANNHQPPTFNLWVSGPLNFDT